MLVPGVSSGGLKLQYCALPFALLQEEEQSLAGHNAHVYISPLHLATASGNSL
jgi:hypothetical protein